MIFIIVCFLKNEVNLYVIMNMESGEKFRGLIYILFLVFKYYSDNRILLCKELNKLLLNCFVNCLGF